MKPSRPLILATATALTAAAGVAVAGASGGPSTPPVVSITSAGSKVTIVGAGALKAGPTTLKLSTPANHTIALGQLKPGKTAADLATAISQAKSDATPITKVAELRGGGGTTHGRPYTFTTDLPAATYEVVDDTNRPKILGEFTVGAGANGAAAPKSDDSITLTDFKISSSSAVPATGTVKVQNAGASPHFLVAFRLKHPADAAKALKALKRGEAGMSQAMKLLDGRSQLELIDLSTPGTTSYVQTHALKRGKWVLACFYADSRSHHKEHSMLGMERVVTVK